MHRSVAHFNFTTEKFRASSSAITTQCRIFLSLLPAHQTTCSIYFYTNNINIYWWQSYIVIVCVTYVPIHLNVSLAFYSFVRNWMMHLRNTSIEAAPDLSRSKQTTLFAPLAKCLLLGSLEDQDKNTLILSHIASAHCI